MLGLLHTMYQESDTISQSEIFYNQHSTLYVNPGVSQIEMRVKKDCPQGAHVLIGTGRVVMTTAYGNGNSVTGHSQRLLFSIYPLSYGVLHEI